MHFNRRIQFLYLANVSKIPYFKCIGIRCLQNYSPQPQNGSQRPERPKLRIMEKSPQYPPNLRPPKMQKKLEFMRGVEKTHNSLIYGQYGIVALTGGRLNSGHFEMLRLTIGRKMDVNRMFSVWRVPAPWQPISKKGQGQRMGGGKGAIDRYETPIKSGRVLVEVGGNCEYAEVNNFLNQVCMQLPFKTVVVSQDMLHDGLEENRYLLRKAMNFTLQYVIQNNFNNCHSWLSQVDHKWFGKYN